MPGEPIKPPSDVAARRIAEHPPTWLALLRTATITACLTLFTLPFFAASLARWLGLKVLYKDSSFHELYSTCYSLAGILWLALTLAYVIRHSPTKAMVAFTCFILWFILQPAWGQA